MKKSLWRLAMTTAIASGGASLAEDIKPNFVIILADDMGYGDPTCYGGIISTPNIDKMAEEGMLFTDFHSNGSVCSPTRAALVTGQYQQRCGIDGVISADPSTEPYKLGVDPSVTSFPKVMSANGYKTALLGKWHLGYVKKYHPMHFGFDRFVGYVSGNIDYLSHYDRMGTYDWWHNWEQVKEDGYTTHLITDHAVDYISANKDNPFCIYVAHEAVHAPMQGPEDAIQRGPDRVKSRKRDNEVVFKDMLQELDKGVGKVLKAIKDNGLEKKTLVIFASDNGPMQFSSPGPLRGRKSSIYEGGHRVPAIAWWPGTVKPGTVTDETCIGMDIFPTMTDLADITGDFEFDGVSLKPVLAGKELDDRKLYWRNTGLHPNATSTDCRDSDKAVRDGKWKLVASAYYRTLELFDLESDLSEKNNLADKYPERVESMKANLIDWEKEMLPTLPYTVLPESPKQPSKRTKN